MTLGGAFQGCRAAHARLLETVAAITDADVARPSRLPFWTVGHVLTHLARNAESHVRILDAAARGEVADQYPGGNAQRRDDIEAGAARSAAELADDMRRTIEELDAAWRRTPAHAWDHGAGRYASAGEVPIVELPFYRWREVEIHHADLGLAFNWEDWSDAYVEAELERTRPGLPDRLPIGVDAASVLNTPPRRLLAWLVGRLDGEPGEFPAIDPWRY